MKPFTELQNQIDDLRFELKREKELSRSLAKVIVSLNKLDLNDPMARIEICALIGAAASLSKIILKDVEDENEID